MSLFNKEIRYTQLNNTHDDDSEKVIGEDVGLSLHPQRSKQRWMWLVHLFLAVVWVLGFIVLGSQLSRARHSNPDRNSPLRDTLTYHTQPFTTGFNKDRTKYQGPPSPANEAAWNHLTNTGIVALTPSETTSLHLDTAVFNSTPNGESETYLGAVEVFHQLHCLDMLRREVFGDLDRWLEEHHSKKNKLEHLDHCVNFLRQSLMCRPSIEVLGFGVDEETGMFHPRFDGVHSCANFEAVRRWSEERRAGELTPQ